MRRTFSSPVSGSEELGVGVVLLLRGRWRKDAILLPSLTILLLVQDGARTYSFDPLVSLLYYGDEVSVICGSFNNTCVVVNCHQ